MPTATRTNPTTPPLVVPVITRAQSLRGVKPIAQPYPKWAQQPAPCVDAVADPDEGDDGDIDPALLHAPLPPDPAVSRPKVKPMSKPEPPMPPTAAADDAVPDAAAKSAPAGADDLESLLDTLAGPRLKIGVRVHRTRPDGSRGEMLFTVPATEHPDSLRERIAKYGPGDYELAPVADGKYNGQARRMVVEAPASAIPVPAAAPAPAAAAAPAGFDVAALLSGLASLQRESQAAQAAQFERMQSAAKDSQIEMLKLFISNRPAEGGASGPDPMMKMLMPLLLAKFGEDPFARVLQMLEINKAVREDSAPPDRTGEIFANLAGTLPALLAGAQQAAPAAAPRTVVAVTAAGKPAPAPGADPAPLPAASLQAIVTDALPMLKRMAAKQADVSTVLGGLGAMLTDAEVSTVLPMLSQAGAVDILLSFAPSLAPYRAWLDALLTDVRAMVADEAAAEAKPAEVALDAA